MSQNDVTNTELHKHWGRSGRSMLNGMIGEYLEKEKNPLAIQMGFYHRSKKLTLDAQLARQLDFPLSNKVVILVHGLTQLETVWEFPPAGRSGKSLISHYIDACFDAPRDSGKETYGSKLQEEFGYTPFYLRYNTGLSLEKNGRNFAAQLTQLFRIYPIEINELMLIGFSMGGTLLRHAQYAAQKNQFSWLETLSKCIYLGNPDESSALDRISHMSRVIRRIPLRYFNLWVDWIGHRSARLQSLKQGMKGLSEAQQREVAFTSYAESARHYFIGSCISQGEFGILSRVLGASWAGERSVFLSAAPTNTQLVRMEGLSYFPLVHSGRVYQLIASWMKEAEETKLVSYFPMQEPAMADTIPLDSSNRALMAGMVDLFASAYDKTLEMVETMHYSIAEEPFYVAQKLPVVCQMVKPIEAAHRHMLDALYRALRSGGRLMHKVAADIASEVSLYKTTTPTKAA